MAYKQLSIEEREKIQEMWWEKNTIRSIAQALKRSPSSISRELRRNFPTERDVYTPRLAHERAMRKRRSRGRAKRLKNERIRSYVRDHLKEGWSPEQIAGRVKKDGVGSISHEAIYQFIYHRVSAASGLTYGSEEDLRVYLKRRHKRRAKKGMRKGARVFRPKGLSIDERPSVVEERSRIGDWEGDTIASRFNAPGVNSLVERMSGLVFLTKVRDKTAEATAEVVIQRLSYVPAHTLTVDNGSENQAWRDIEAQIGTRSYYAHPYHSWERGTNENTNGLVRWYFPKGTDFRTIPKKEITRVEYLLNTRPRKRLGWKTPLEVFTHAVALDD